MGRRLTTAEFWMPASTQPIAHHGMDEPPKSAPESAKLTVLVVDDDALISMSTALMVEDLGHDVVEVNSGVDALDILPSGRQIDLLITDFSMPKMNGVQLARAAKEVSPQLPVLLATGYAELPVEKSWGLRELASRISRSSSQPRLRQHCSGPRTLFDDCSGARILRNNLFWLCSQCRRPFGRTC
jgi:CheY-like chemotaxis protein